MWLPFFSVMFSDQQIFVQENKRNSDCYEDFFIFSVTDFQYKFVQASVPSPFSHPFSLLMKVTPQPNIFCYTSRAWFCISFLAVNQHINSLAKSQKNAKINCALWTERLMIKIPIPFFFFKSAFGLPVICLICLICLCRGKCTLARQLPNCVLELQMKASQETAQMTTNSLWIIPNMVFSDAISCLSFMSDVARAMTNHGLWESHNNFLRIRLIIVVSFQFKEIHSPWFLCQRWDTVFPDKYCGDLLAFQETSLCSPLGFGMQTCMKPITALEESYRFLHLSICVHANQQKALQLLL